MKRYERLNAILELLAEDSKLDVDTAAPRLGVSEATIRRDLEYLAEQQLLTRTHGGAVANSTSYDLPLRFKSGRHAQEKQRIAHAAAALVPAGGIIGMNGGTTSTETARAIGARADLTPSQADGVALTLVTNALNIAYELAVRSHIKIVVTGGVARSSSYELTGPLAADMLDQLHLDVALLGVDAVDPELGAMTHNEGEAMINRLLADHARTVIVVADSTKLGMRAFARIRPIDRLDVLVTDSEADPELVKRFTEAGVRVITA